MHCRGILQLESAPAAKAAPVEPRMRDHLYDWIVSSVGDTIPFLARRGRLQLSYQSRCQLASHLRCTPRHTTRAAYSRQGRAWTRMRGQARGR